MKAYIYLFPLFLFTACNSSQKPADEEPTPATEVSLTTIQTGSIGQTVTVQAQTDYLHQVTLTAPVTGYIRVLTVRPDDPASRGKLIFTMVSAEQQALGMTATHSPSTHPAPASSVPWCLRTAVS